MDLDISAGAVDVDSYNLIHWNVKILEGRKKTSQRMVCCKCAVIDEIVQMCHYLLYTSAWVTGNKEKMGEWERLGGSSCLHEYPSCQFHSDLWRVLPNRGQMTFTQLSEEDISGQGFPYHIPLRPRRCPGSVYLSVCRFVCVCCWVKLTLCRSSGQRSTAGCIPCVLVCHCGSARPSVYVVTIIDKSHCIASTVWTCVWLCKIDMT